MLKVLVGTAVLAITAVPVTAGAQSVNLNPTQGKVSTPSAQHSGAGIPAKRGSEAGRMPRHETSGSTTVGSNPHAHSHKVREQDAAKIPGKAGGKSGPAVKPPSGTPSSGSSSKQ